MTAPVRGESRTLWFAAALLSIAVCVPLMFARFPPSTDIAQHVAQMPLMRAALRHPEGNLAVQWFAPNVLAYVFVALGWFTAPHLVAGRVALAGLLITWIVGTVALADARRRPLVAVLVAAFFAFSNSLYWGFIEFLLGWPCFALYVAAVAPLDRPMTRKRWALVALAAVGLYGAHVLWLGAAFVSVIVLSVAEKQPWRTIAKRVAPIVPMLVAAAIWSARLHGERAGRGFVLAPKWFTWWRRLFSGDLVTACLGGLKGSLEPALLGLFALYAVVAALTARKKGGLDRGLLALAALLFTGYVVLPDVYENTLLFHSRWMPSACVLLALSLPAPEWRPLVMRRLVTGVFVLFVVETTLAWVAFSDDEMNGFERVLAALPNNERVVGLDFVRSSELIEGMPYFQMFAYAQVLHGGVVNFSFVEHGSSLVYARHLYPRPYAPGLEWKPTRFGPQDAAYFDYAIVNARPEVHRRMATLRGIEPVTTEGPWRLYHFVHASLHE